ncbi:MAG: TIGR04053 family radical SAM/SPASM domain-containing protein [Nitrososphaeria archaeon]|nr:TIGR04053 family radical SAM/SPASM domain-containing protein [Nitrososphaeria archaeon]NIQ33235.1 TIGR04053 family radical SAM/SPASM domain-containing protein [Nitrososphaeria archaeon]
MKSEEAWDFSFKPFIVIWEATRACLLACRHCRAEAITRRHPRELTTDEVFTLIDQIVDFGEPHPLFVITGGDPLMRSDIYRIIRYGSNRGLRVTISPSVTPLLTDDNLLRLKEAGISALALSLDGSGEEIHDGFRGVEGVYERTLEVMRLMEVINLPLQVNTTVTRLNIDDLPNIFRYIYDLNAMTWSVFFLVPTGRGKVEDEISPQEYEDVLNFIYDAFKYGVPVKTTEAQHFRRVTLQRQEWEKRGVDHEGKMKLSQKYHELRTRLTTLMGDAPSRPASRSFSTHRPSFSVNAGKGFIFISHVGDVYPSGFLPFKVGDIRMKSITEIYRGSTVLRELRDPSKLKSKCGKCDYRFVCGGSRSRTYALTGDYLEAERYCVYEPVTHSQIDT